MAAGLRLMLPWGSDDPSAALVLREGAGSTTICIAERARSTAVPKFVQLTARAACPPTTFLFPECAGVFCCLPRAKEVLASAVASGFLIRDSTRLQRVEGAVCAIVTVQGGEDLISLGQCYQDRHNACHLK
eukprot:CAMPEP_0181506512 /NCGR_PEP_ID=MMETSP1110-20121109/58636_1 /TAXON_ID=174948 /ORGANISM="Symbiodinium sp., Strain CCMP421" /LENGTH=130 /DNA_ID=CAMNT_0023635579 /DNA_START=301 /DNA_END=693 /DNA_ORIENTATION=+